MAKYYICSVCGNIVEMVEDKGNTPYCCNKPMRELIPASTDGAVEKHVPVVTLESKDDATKVLVSVGSDPHPMESHHYIGWIVLETNKGMHRVMLTPDCQPRAVFYICKDETILATYAYCNLHGLWKG